MTAELDALLESVPVAPASLTGAVGRKCPRHQWMTTLVDYGNGPNLNRVSCVRCGIIRDETRSRRGRQSRNYGNRAELSASRKYGGTKVGHVGGPVDVRGAEWNLQVKTHRRLPPLEWTKAFQAMAGKGERLPRLLLRFVMGPGVPPADYMVIPGDVWLDWFGRDDE